MDLETAISFALEDQALLFAGSGFSYGATNINKTSFNVGDKLRDVIASDCGIDTQRPLSVVSEYYIAEKTADRLIKLLKSEFSVSTVAPWHDTLLSVHWKRIYTTNYDSVIEVAAQHNRRSLTPIVPSDRLTDADLYNVCIHLNGHIDSLNRETLNNEFKLIDTSYSYDALEGNEWFELFKGDLQTSKAIIIIGYSMQFDIDIKRLLSSPAVKDKVVFIDSPTPDIVDKRLLEQYGHCEFIGIEQFASQVNALNRTFVRTLLEPDYRSFIHEFRATLPPAVLSFNDINALYTKGRFTDLHMQKNLDEYKYLAFRKAVDLVVRDYLHTKVFLATSDLGNGKTVFCQLVRNELRAHEVDVFTFSHQYNDIEEEIQRISLKNDRHSIIIIDNYKNKLDILKQFKYCGINKITFVLTTRKSVNPSYKNIINALNLQESDIRPLYLDLLDDKEVELLSYVIANNDLYNSRMNDRTPKGIKDYIRTTCHSRFADLLLDTYNSSDIKMRISKVWWNNSDESEPIKQLAVLSLMKSVMGIDFNFSEMLDLLKIDYAMLPARDNEFVNEFFDVMDDDITIKSSIVARELLRSVVGIDNLLNTMKTAIYEANKEYQVNGVCFDLLKNLVSHSHFRIFQATSDNQSAITNFYDSIRNLKFCKENVFFWEQFASACIDTRNFDAANQCIENAFTLAASIPGFVPFHIENIKANCLIENLLFDMTTDSRPSASITIEILVDCHSRLVKHFSHPENNISYTFRVGSKYAKVFEAYRDEFDKRETSIFIEKKTEMLKLMKAHKSSSAFINHPLVSWISDLEMCV